jgi:protocatechuate 3,4-dioxygenase beta subunit
MAHVRAAAAFLLTVTLSAQTPAPPAAAEPRTTAPRADDDAELAPLLTKAKAAAKAGKHAGELLATAEFAPLHELTAFRALVKAAARAEELRLSLADEPGKPLTVIGTVANKQGHPVADALVYAYHTSAKGWYSDRAPHFSGDSADFGHARLFGYVRTDAEGRFVLRTIRPGGYPRSTLPEHIHVEVFVGDASVLVSEVLFDDDARLVGETRDRSIKEGLVITKPEVKDGVAVVRPVLVVDVPVKDAKK